VGRTFVIGDVHGELEMLERLLARLPARGPDDTLLFIGDYVDRGPQSRELVERVRALAGADATSGGGRVVALMGNHEEMWATCAREPAPHAGYLLAAQNGCWTTFCSFTSRADPKQDLDGLKRFLDVPAWFPKEVAAWMEALPRFHEDEHAIYVHAGLDENAGRWVHPGEGRPRPLLWTRDQEFFDGYRGKRVVFGHTETKLLDPDGAQAVWVHGDLVGLDTGAGKGGWLSCVELPSLTIYDSR
jgi:serine/threonine protein phosphatase 1